MAKETDSLEKESNTNRNDFVKLKVRQISSYLKSNWFVFILLILFVVLSYLICRCAWFSIGRLVKDVPKRELTQQVMKVQIEMPDSLNEKVLDRLKSIEDALRERKNDSIAVIIKKNHKRK